MDVGVGAALERYTERCPITSRANQARNGVILSLNANIMCCVAVKVIQIEGNERGRRRGSRAIQIWRAENTNLRETGKKFTEASPIFMTVYQFGCGSR